MFNSNDSSVPSLFAGFILNDKNVQTILLVKHVLTKYNPLDICDQNSLYVFLSCS